MDVADEAADADEQQQEQERWQCPTVGIPTSDDTPAAMTPAAARTAADGGGGGGGDHPSGLQSGGEAIARAAAGDADDADGSTVEDVVLEVILMAQAATRGGTAAGGDGGGGGTAGSGKEGEGVVDAAAVATWVDGGATAMEVEGQGAGAAGAAGSAAAAVISEDVGLLLDANDGPSDRLGILGEAEGQQLLQREEERQLNDPAGQASLQKGTQEVARAQQQDQSKLCQPQGGMTVGQGVPKGVLGPSAAAASAAGGPPLSLVDAEDVLAVFEAEAAAWQGVEFMTSGEGVGSFAAWPLLVTQAGDTRRLKGGWYDSAEEAARARDMACLGERGNGNEKVCRDKLVGGILTLMECSHAKRQ
jgi:hypothetical protein